MKIGEYEVTVVDNNTVEVGCVTVRLDQVKEIQRMMYDWKPSPKFKVGDFVRVKDDAGDDSFIESRRGQYGKVVKIVPLANYQIGVEFPFPLQNGNSLDGQTKNKHGLWFKPEHLELVD